MVFQQFNLFHNLNVLNNITLAPIMRQKGATKPLPKRKRMKLLARVGLAGQGRRLS